MDHRAEPGAQGRAHRVIEARKVAYDGYPFDEGLLLVVGEVHPARQGDHTGRRDVRSKGYLVDAVLLGKGEVEGHVAVPSEDQAGGRPGRRGRQVHLAGHIGDVGIQEQLPAHRCGGVRRVGEDSGFDDLLRPELELSKEKTLITHATSQAARFLGYELVKQQANDQLDLNGRRRVNGRIGLRVPAKVIEQHCQAYMRNGKPAHRSYLLHDDDYGIVARYQSEYRGVVQYYLLAYNVSHFGRLHGVMEMSLVRTLAAKHKSTARKMRRQHKSVVETEHGPRVCLKVIKQQDNGKGPLVAYFGGIPLKRQRQAVLVDQQPQRYRTDRNELVKRLLADKCEMCGSTVDVEVHHIRALRDLNVKGQREKPKWVQLMAARKRKTLVVCRTCHVDIHAGRSNPQSQQ